MDLTDAEIIARTEAARRRALGPPPEVDPILGRPVESENPTGTGGALTSLKAAVPELTTLGTPGETTCQFCGLTVSKELREVPGYPSLRLWAYPPHQCEGMRASEAAAMALAAQQKAEAEEARRQRLLHPTPERIAQVRRRCRLPQWTPAGMAELRTAECDPSMVALLNEHLSTWRSGRRPERGVWIYGHTDRRKTCATAAMLWDVSHWTDRPALMWNLENLMSNLRRAAGGQRHEYDRTAIEDAHLLLLDDIGTVKATDTLREVLFGIVNAAVDCWGGATPQQTLYVTSNEDPDEVERLLYTPDQPKAAERIVRRLVQLCDIQEVAQ